MFSEGRCRGVNLGKRKLGGETGRRGRTVVGMSCMRGESIFNTK